MHEKVIIHMVAETAEEHYPKAVGRISAIGHTVRNGSGLTLKLPTRGQKSYTEAPFGDQWTKQILC